MALNPLLLNPKDPTKKLSEADKTDPFSGEADLKSIDPSQILLGMEYARARTDAEKAYETSFPKYEKRLKPFAYHAPKRDIFDLASDLGAGILASQQQGGTNPYVGIGVGFNAFSQRLKKEQADNLKSAQQMGMQAASLALQSEQQAKDYLNQMGIKLIDMANKKTDFIRIEYDEVDPETGEIEVKSDTFPNTPAYKAQIMDLMENKNGREMKLADNQINIEGPNRGKKDLIAYESVDAAGKEYATKAKAAGAVIDQVNEAFILAERVKLAGGEFGPFSDMTLSARELVDSLGFGDLLSAPGAIAPQKALRQLSMGFVLSIISQTKGAISEKEMDLFINASPTLGSTEKGYMMQLRLLERLARRDKDFYNDYLDKKSQLIEQEVSGQKMEVELEKFANGWRDNNPLLTREDEAVLRKAADQAAQEAKGEGAFVPSAFQKLFDDRKRELTGYKVVTSQAEYDSLEDGEKYIEDGLVFTKK